MITQRGMAAIEQKLYDELRAYCEENGLRVRFAVDQAVQRWLTERKQGKAHVKTEGKRKSR